jgi:hypothetical protein
LQLPDDTKNPAGPQLALAV